MKTEERKDILMDYRTDKKYWGRDIGRSYEAVLHVDVTYKTAKQIYPDIINCDPN